METVPLLQVRGKTRNSSNWACRRPMRTVQALGKRARRVLVVDAYRDAGESLGALLEMWGYKTKVVCDAPAALEAAHERRPDVVILDVVLPQMDGYELATRLRRFETFRDVLLVALTGYVRPGDNERANMAGLDFFLLKPADPDVLHRLVRTASRQREPEGQSIVYSR